MKMWTKKNNALHLEIQGDTFPTTKEFISSVLDLADKHQHHPTLKNTYTKVELILTTHDEGNTVTQKDTGLAKEITSLVETNKHLHAQ